MICGDFRAAFKSIVVSGRKFRKGFFVFFFTLLALLSFHIFLLRSSSFNFAYQKYLTSLMVLDYFSEFFFQVFCGNCLKL